MQRDLEKMEAEVMEHSRISNQYISKELARLTAQDAKTALLVANSMMDLSTACAEIALPPDEYSAQALRIIADSITHANKEMGISSLETCKVVRGQDLQDRFEAANDPWEEAS